jgi:AraC-like DNA-binding protein
VSCALAVFHGLFGRATVYRLNRPFSTHAHREGHLIFQIGGPPCAIEVSGRRYDVGLSNILAVNPWEPHNFIPSDLAGGSTFLVLYIKTEWFEKVQTRPGELYFLSSLFDRTPGLGAAIATIADMICSDHPPTRLDDELRHLIEICHAESFDKARGISSQLMAQASDFRIRKSIKLMSSNPSSRIELDLIARESGLSRPHFYKLFRDQTGITPNLYLNTLLIEKSLDLLVHSKSTIADVGIELGFPTQSHFAHFFSSNVGLPPSAYRRAIKVFA